MTVDDILEYSTFKVAVFFQYFLDFKNICFNIFLGTVWAEPPPVRDTEGITQVDVSTIFLDKYLPDPGCPLKSL